MDHCGLLHSLMLVVLKFASNYGSFRSIHLWNLDKLRYMATKS